MPRHCALRKDAAQSSATSFQVQLPVSRATSCNDGRARHRHRIWLNNRQADADRENQKCAAGIRRAREISFVKWSGVRPDPANAMPFQKPNELWPMPSGVTKFNRKAEIPRQLTEKIAQRQLAILRRERRRKLDQDDAKFCSKRFDGAEEQV